MPARPGDRGQARIAVAAVEDVDGGADRPRLIEEGPVPDEIAVGLRRRDEDVLGAPLRLPEIAGGREDRPRRRDRRRRQRARGIDGDDRPVGEEDDAVGGVGDVAEPEVRNCERAYGRIDRRADIVEGAEVVLPQRHESVQNRALLMLDSGPRRFRVEPGEPVEDEGREVLGEAGVLLRRAGEGEP
jgi:hypothetical protein